MLESLKYHHIGIACDNIYTTARIYESFGYKQGDFIVDNLQNIEICFLEHPTMPKIELLGKTNEKSPIIQTLAKVGTAPYHICYEVTDIDKSISELKALKFLVVAKPKPACAINNKRVAFLYNKDMGLIELVES